MSQRFYRNGRQVDADGRDLLTGGDPWALPHGCSWSGAEVFLKSRRTYQRQHHIGDMAREATRPMKFGQVTHFGVLEPPKFKEHVAVGPEFSRVTRVGKAATFDGPLLKVTDKKDSKAWKDARAEHPDHYVVTPEEFAEATEIRERLAELDGKILVTQEEYDKVLAIREAVWAHPLAERLLTRDKLKLEAATHWMDPSGLEISAHPDGISPGECFDLKTSADIRPAPFIRSCEKYGYFRQAGLYLVDAHQEFFGGPGERFFHIACSNAEPFDVEVYEMDPEWIDDGIREMRDTFNRVAYCAANEDWRTPSQRCGGALVLSRPIGAGANRAAFEMPEVMEG